MFNRLLKEKSVFYFIILMFMVMCGLAIGKAGSESYFIGYIEVISFPILLIINGVLLIIVASIYSVFQRKIQRFLLLTYLLGIFFLCMVLFQVLFFDLLRSSTLDHTALGNVMLPYIVFSGYEILLLIFQVHFWTCANDVFNPAQGKKYFPLIGAAGLAGTILGGVIAGVSAPLFGHHSLFLFWTFFIGVSVILAFGIQKLKLSSIFVDVADRAFLTLSDFREYPLLRFLAFINIPLWFVIHSIDWLFYHAIHEVFPGDLSKTSSLIGYLGGFTTFLALVLQLGFTAWLLKRFGVGVAYASQPLAVLFASLSLVLREFATRSSSLFSLRNVLAVFTRIFDEPFFNSFYDASVQLLFGAVPQRIRGQARTFIIGIIEPLIMLFSGIIFYTWEANGISLKYLTIFILILAIIWFLFSLRVRFKYLTALTTSLREKSQRYDDIKSLKSYFNTDPKSNQKILESITNNNDQIALMSLNSFADAYTGDRFTIIFSKLNEMSNIVFARALDIIVERKLTEAKPLLINILKVGGKRGALVLRALGKLDPVGSRDLFEKYLVSHDKRLYAETVLYFLKVSKDEKHLSYVNVYRHLLKSKKISDRLLALDINLELDEPILIKEIIQILNTQKQRDEIRLAIKILAKVPDKEGIEAVMQWLSDKEIRVIAIQALKQMAVDKPWIQDKLIADYKTIIETCYIKTSYQDNVVPLPAYVFLKKSQKLQYQSQLEGIIQTLGAIGNVDSAKCLIHILTDYMGNIDNHSQKFILSVLLEIRQRMHKDKKSLDDESLQKMRLYFVRMMKQLSSYRNLYKFSIMKMKQGKETEEFQEYLQKALSSEIRDQFEMILKILAFCWKSADMDFVFLLLDSQETRDRAEAIEILESIRVKFDIKRDQDTLHFKPSTSTHSIKKQALKKTIIKEKGIFGGRIYITPLATAAADDQPDQKQEKLQIIFYEQFYSLLDIVAKGDIVDFVESEQISETSLNQKTAAYDEETMVFLIRSSYSKWLRMLALFMIGEIQLTKALPALIRYCQHNHVLLRYASLWSLSRLGYNEYKQQLNNMDVQIDIVFFLKTVPIFAEVSADDILLLSEISNVIQCRPNTKLFSEGDPGHEFYIVKKGSVGIYKNNLFIATVEERDCFGEMAIVESRSRSATAKTEEQTELIVFSRSDFLKLMMAQPRITYSLFVNANQKLRELGEKVTTPSS